MKTKYKDLLLENINSVRLTLSTFDYSYKKCMAIGVKIEYSDAEFESFESFTARFARLSDILTQKLMRSIFIVEREASLSFIDMCNLAEKRGIISHSEKLIEIRDLRNEISHEYRVTELNELFETCLQLSNNLLHLVHSTIEYATQLANKI